MAFSRKGFLESFHDAIAHVAAVKGMGMTDDNSPAGGPFREEAFDDNLVFCYKSD
jgi:hypothetical protein